MSDLNSTIPLIIGVDHGFEVLVGDEIVHVGGEIVLPGGPHECILGTGGVPAYEVLDWCGPREMKDMLDFYPHFIDPMPWIDDILSVILIDPRSTQNMIRYPSGRGSSLDVFLTARRAVEPDLGEAVKEAVKRSYDYD